MSAFQARAVLVIPALDEQDSLPSTLDRVPRGMYRSVIVADNGSRDRTAQVAREHGATVVWEPERGYGAACLRAIDALPDGIEAVVFMQADGSEEPEEAGSLLSPIYEGRAELVIGSRALGRPDRGALPSHQALGNRLAVALIRTLYGHRYTDLGPYRAIRVDSLRRLEMQDRSYGWTAEMQIKALKCGLRVLEDPVSYQNRTAGAGKVSGSLKGSLAAGAKIIWTVARLAAAR